MSSPRLRSQKTLTALGLNTGFLMAQAWVYILRCSDGTLYTGSTTDIDNRLYEHKTGFYGGYTSRRRPVRLVWSDQFPDYQQAFDWERQIKGWSRKKKETLIRGDFASIHELAQSTEMRERRKKRSQLLSKKTKSP